MRAVSYLSPGIRRELFERLASLIGASLDFVTTASGPSEGENPFRAGEFDVGWICSTSFVELASSGERPPVKLVGVGWVPDDADADGRPVYYADVVVRSETDATSLGDLQGRRIACNDEVSLSGHHALREAIRTRGLAVDGFAHLVFTGGHHRSLNMVIAGEVDAGVIDSVVRTERARRDPAVADLDTIERLGPWPVQALVARADLDDRTVERARHALLSANEDPEIRDVLRASALRRLASMDAHDYEPVWSAFSAPGLLRPSALPSTDQVVP